MVQCGDGVRVATYARPGIGEEGSRSAYSDNDVIERVLTMRKQAGAWKPRIRKGRGECGEQRSGELIR